MLNGFEVAQRASEQLAQITGLKPGTVSALSEEDQGWRVTVDMIEMKYIPDTRDVLALYEARLDSKGNLLSYQRTRRYRRDQTTDEE